MSREQHLRVHRAVIFPFGPDGWQEPANGSIQKADLTPAGRASRAFASMKRVTESGVFGRDEGCQAPGAKEAEL